MDGNGDPLEAPTTDDNNDDPENLESEYDGECYFARHPEEINPDLSLGIIEWKAAVPTQTALPSTFGEAELEKMAPRSSRPSVDGCVSEYFAPDKREEALLSVRQLDTWHEVKDDLIFREFPMVCQHLIALQELHERLRCRIDQAWIDAGNYDTPDSSREPTPAIQINPTQEDILAALGVTGAPKPPARKRSLSRDDWEEQPRKQQRLYS